jgi:hypothetical protein
LIGFLDNFLLSFVDDRLLEKLTFLFWNDFQLDLLLTMNRLMIWLDFLNRVLMEFMIC